jgi:hypothetical protein
VTYWCRDSSVSNWKSALHFHIYFVTSRQCTCNVTSRRVRANIVAIEYQYFVLWECICSQHAIHMRYILICGLSVRLYSVFFLPYKQHILFKTVLLKMKCVLPIFSTTFAWNISLSKENWARHDQNCVLVFMQSTRYSCQILMNESTLRNVTEERRTYLRLGGSLSYFCRLRATSFTLLSFWFCSV